MAPLIKPADEKERDQLIERWIEKALWLRDRGLDMWQLDQFTPEGLRAKYDDPQYFIGYEGGAVFGGFILLEYDRRYWPEKKDDRAFYLHKFLVCNAFTGQGYPRVMVDWICDRARAQGKGWIRLDYDSDRPKLKAMYHDLGFQDVEVLGRGTGHPITKAELRVE